MPEDWLILMLEPEVESEKPAWAVEVELVKKGARSERLAAELLPLPEGD